jgi:diguanylate cyclase (GGDEF)-like protein
MDFEITRFAEFKNKSYEDTFFTRNVIKSLSYVRFVLLGFCLFNFFLVFFDYLLLDAGSKVNIVFYSLLPRTAILLFAVVFFFVSKRRKACMALINSVSIFILIFYALHLYMAYHFNDPDLTMESLDVVFIILCISTVPNRWIVNLTLSVFAGGLFLTVTPLFITGMTLSVIPGLILYLCLTIAIVSISSFQINWYKRKQFVREAQLDQLAQTDPLTKSYNRLKCDTEITRRCLNEQGFSAILLDIDNFKEINDTYGHIVGDKVLVETVETILQNIREIDVLARWGGDEFLIVLDGTSLEAALNLAERLRQIFETRTFGGLPHMVSASFGVTEYVKGDDLYSIFDRIDKMLYSVKAAGKNKIYSD